MPVMVSEFVTFPNVCVGVIAANALDAAFASFSAAQWLAPFGRTGTHYLMADAEGVQDLRAVLQLAPASKGDNLIIIVPKDVALLGDTVEPAPGAVCTSPVQTYLDLSIAGERGAEAADIDQQRRDLGRVEVELDAEIRIFR